MTDRQPLTNLCNCKAEHWQPHVESCLAYKPRPLLTLENIRSGAFPSDAHAVGFLLGEIELLRDQRDTNLAKEVERIDSLTAQRDHWLEIAREKAAEIERLQFELKAARAELEIADAHIAAKVTAHEPLQQRWVERSKEESDRMLADAFKTQQFQPDTSPLTHQEIFSAVHHHAAEIVKLTAAVPAQCAPGASRDASSEPCEQLDSGKTKLAIAMLDRFRDGRLQTAEGTHTSLLGPRDQLLQEADWFDHAAKVLHSSL